MRKSHALLTLAFLCSAAAHATERTNCHDGLEFDARGVRTLTLRIAPGDIRIGPARDSFVRLRCALPGGASTTRVGVDWYPAAPDATLRITGAHLQNQRFYLEVPQDLNLIVRVNAGKLIIRGVQGSKDVQLSAGELRLDLGPDSGYAHVDATVWAGEIRASSLHIRKGGLFRTFSHHYTRGKHTLRARVGAGELTLE